MARNGGTTREEVESILGRYRQSGLTRQEYCRREGLTVYTLDYYQRRLQKLREREDATATAKTTMATLASGKKAEEPLRTRLARVKAPVQVRRGEESNSTLSPAAAQGFAMTLPNGRRIEVTNWGFPEDDLARLIQVVERA